MKTIREMTTEVCEMERANGWREQPRTFGEGIALLHSEVSEAFEAWRDHGFSDVTRPEITHCTDPQCGDSTWDHACGDGVKPGKPEGVGSELADILIRLLGEADRAGVDLDAEYERKMAYNRTRGYHHGGKRI